MNKYSLFPVQNQKLWEAFKTHQAMLWTTEELDFTQDVEDLKRLNPGEMRFITHVLAFFAQSDGIVNENLAARFYSEVNLPSARAFYSLQMYIETIHAETYGMLIDTYVPKQEDKDRLFNAIETVPCVKKKAEWALKWIDSQESFAKRLIAFAIVEGIFFSGSFCAIYWLRKRGLLPGLAAANDLIARDEGLHWTFARDLYRELDLSITIDEYRSMLSEAVEIEKEFITESLPVSLIGMNKELMAQYIEYTADRLSQAFGFPAGYQATNPFDFMTLLDIQVKTNFFEARVTSYQKAGDRTLGFDSEF